MARAAFAARTSTSWPCRPRTEAPSIVISHEGVGVVTEIGPGVTSPGAG
ncbi:MAG: hypothetical protein R2854_06800 [Caldilineaceae bacterium]